VSGETYTPDITIVELDREVEFIPEFISPLCLPPSGRVNDRSSNTTNVKAFVAGWGAS